MEDDKLAAYYDDLTRRGGGAARFKQGLGFSVNSSSTNDDVPSRGSALPAASSFLSSFVKASSPSKTSEFEKQAQLQSIQNKLSKKPKSRSRSPSRDRIRDSHSKLRSRSHSRSRSRTPSRERIGDKHSKRRTRSRSRDRHSRRRSRSRSRDRRSRRRSRSREDGSGRRHRSRSRSREKNRQRSKRQGSPEERRSDKGKKREEVRGGGGIDFAKLIDGYDSMVSSVSFDKFKKLRTEYIWGFFDYGLVFFHFAGLRKVYVDLVLGNLEVQ